jgi:hypothetical protein
MVNRYAQRLKGLGSRVNSALPAADSLLYRPGKLQGSLYGTLLHNITGYAMAVTFLTVGPDDTINFSLGVPVNDIVNGNLLVGTEAHIQRRIMLKTETTARVIELK